MDPDELTGFIWDIEISVPGGEPVVALKCDNCQKTIATYPSVTWKRAMDDAYKHMGELD